VRRVAQQKEIQPVFASKALQQLDRVGTYPDNDHTVLFEPCFCVTELGRFYRSTRGIRFGIKENQNAFPFEIFQRHFFAFVGRKYKVGSPLAYFQHHCPPRPQILFGSFRFSANSFTNILVPAASPAVQSSHLPLSLP
jgi:hypothetical protein